jgi:hypothetical protein
MENAKEINRFFDPAGDISECLDWDKARRPGHVIICRGGQPRLGETGRYGDQQI